jgi:excisionase family DNA binding protein
LEERITYRPLEAAKMLGIGKSKVYELMARKELPSIRLGGSLLIPVHALRQWIEDELKKP